MAGSDVPSTATPGERDSAGPIVGHSRSTTGLSASKLHEKALCDLVANVAKGCSHGCSFCYNRAAPQYRHDPGGEIEAHGVDDPSDAWGEYVLYRHDLPETVASQLAHSPPQQWTERGRGVVGLSFGTDPYMDATTARITGQTLRLLRDHGRPARILTRNPTLAWKRHRRLLVEMAQYGLATIGTSVPSLEDDHVAAIEPLAPPVERRLADLASFEAAGVPIYVSMSPTYPTLDRMAVRSLLMRLSEVNPSVIFHEPINPRRGNLEASVEAAEQADAPGLAAALRTITDDRTAWRQYALSQFRDVQEIGADLGLPIHLWPDAQLIEATSGAVAEWLTAWKQAQSPEPFPDREHVARDPGEMPPLPATQRTLQESIHG
ncbi:MAG: radical SAM protein [Haloferacaceae archaeon]